MSSAEIEQLWARFLAGENLNEREEQGLVDAFEADEGLRRDLVADQGLHHGLLELGRGAQATERFVGGFTALLRAERAGDKFVQSFTQRVKSERRKARFRLWPGLAWLFGGLGLAAAALALWLRPRSPVATVEKPGARAVATMPADGTRAAKGPVTVDAREVAAGHSRALAAAERVDAAPARGTVPGDEAPFFSVDFEDAAHSRLLTNSFGVVVEGPPHPGSRFCAAGTVSTWTGDVVVGLRNDKGIAPFVSGAVLSFDYWLKGDSKDLRTKLWTPEKLDRYEVASRDIVRERWARMAIPLSEFKPRPGELPLAEGDQIGGIEVVAAPGNALFVDNVRVTRR